MILSIFIHGKYFTQVDIWEALKAQKPSRPTTPNMTTEEERQLQRYTINTLKRILFMCYVFSKCCH